MMRLTGNCSSCSVRATSFSWFSRVSVEAANAVMSLASASAVFWVPAHITNHHKHCRTSCPRPFRSTYKTYSYSRFYTHYLIKNYYEQPNNMQITCHTPVTYALGTTVGLSGPPLCTSPEFNDEVSSMRRSDHIATSSTNVLFKMSSDSCGAVGTLPRI